MPANTKAHRWKKIRSRRVVYVSWVDPTPNQRGWIDMFWLRLGTDLQALFEHGFDEPLQTIERQTADADPGIVGALDATLGRDVVTDFIAVLTTKYVAVNTDRREAPSTGEMARFVDRVVKANLGEQVRVFLAPVDQPNWRVWRIRDLWLSETEANGWLVRLKDDRFTWPSEHEPRSMDEIARAVAVIIGDR